MDNFIGFFRKVTTKTLKVTKNLQIGDKSVYAGTGKTFYVDSGASGASDSNSGANWTAALATLDGAINKCTANQGDTIIIAEGHSESYTTTGAKATFDVAGVNVIGLGSGSNRPTFSFGHTGATFTISAANITIENLLFVTAVDSVVTFATISGNDCALINCESRDVTDKEVVTDFTVTGDRFTAYNHFKNGYVAGNANDCVFSLNGVDSALIQGCIFLTKALTSVIEFVTAASSEVVVDQCTFLVSGTTDLSKNVVDTITGSTWIVQRSWDIGAGEEFSGGSAKAMIAKAHEMLGCCPSINHPNYLAVTADLTSATWNTQATHEVFTVTGAVRMIVWIEVTDAVTDTGDAGTLTFGIESDADAWIASSDSDDLAANTFWADATPGDVSGNFSSLVLDKVVIGEDVGYEIGGEALTGGSITFHCVYQPLNSTGAVAAGAGGVLA